MPSRLRFGDVEIDLEAFELRRGGALTPVEPQVFDLVCHLAGNPGRLVSKDELIKIVWNGRIVSDATLASRILGVVRETDLAYCFGASAAMDAFNVAFRIPNLLRDLFAEGAMTAAFVPAFTRTLTERGREHA